MLILTKYRKSLAFSLVELSIVLVILGLLVGGVLSGQALIHAAELRSVTTEYNRWAAATRSFRDKYFALPGDFNNAQSFWGAASACPGTNANTTSAGIATCNGDGDGMIQTGSLTVANETYRFWQHLANAGLIEGSFTGVANSTTSTDMMDSVTTPNVPASKLKGADWNIRYLGNLDYTDATYFDGNYGNAFRFGSGTNGINYTMKPEDVWNIDTKMDDGQPGTGFITTLKFQANATTSIACTTPATTTTSSIAAASVYNFTVTANRCSMVIKSGL